MTTAAGREGCLNGVETALRAGRIYANSLTGKSSR